MKLIRLIGAALTLTSLLAVQPAFAARPLAKRQQHQRQRIRQGVRNGTLTKKEANHLWAQQRVMAAQTRQARASGGRLTKGERRHLLHEYNQSNHSIYRTAHNSRKRW